MELTAEEVRVLAALVEKEATTPEHYPLSTNALRLACNQTTNRDPVVDYSERTVDAVMLTLREGGLARTLHGAGHRVAKHRHTLGVAWGLDGEAMAVLAVLALRGPQTEAELKTRTERYADGPRTADAVSAALQRLATREDPLIQHLERRPGEREARVTHLLHGEPLHAVPTADTGVDHETRRDRLIDIESRLRTLESAVDDLSSQLAALRQALGD